MGCGGKIVARQVGVVQRAEVAVDDHIRVQIQHPVKLTGQIFGGEDAVVHLFGVTVGDRSVS